MTQMEEKHEAAMATLLSEKARMQQELEAKLLIYAGNTSYRPTNKLQINQTTGIRTDGIARTPATHAPD